MKPIHWSLSLGIALVACSTASGGSNTSTLEGSIAAGFPGHPTAIRATSDTGALVSSPLAKDGSFKIALDKGHSYRLDVIGSGAEPVVFPRTSGRLDTTFRVSGGSAHVALGQLRHFDAEPAAGVTMIGKVTTALSSGAVASSDCVGGTIPSTGAACADDDTSGMTCEAGGTEAEDDTSSSAEVEDGECVNGKDSVTGLACTDPPEASDAAAADPASAMAIPDHNVPDDVGGCDTAEEED